MVCDNFVFAGGGQPCSNCQVTFVNLTCDSSKKAKGRHARNPSNKGVTRITLELEAEVKAGDTTGKPAQSLCGTWHLKGPDDMFYYQFESQNIFYIMIIYWPGSCNLSCLRQRMEKQVKTYIKALKKSINQERFLIRVAGLEYEVAQKLPQAAPIQDHCAPGWERINGRCGKPGVVPSVNSVIYRHMSDFWYSGCFFSYLLARFLLPWGTGTLCPVSTWHFPGERGAAGLWPLPR